MRPTVGRIVHYTTDNKDSKQRVFAALITKVTPREGVTYAELVEVDYHVSLRVFHPIAVVDRSIIDVPFTMATAGSEEARGHWTWPPREGGAP